MIRIDSDKRMELVEPDDSYSQWTREVPWNELDVVKKAEYIKIALGMIKEFS